MKLTVFEQFNILNRMLTFFYSTKFFSYFFDLFYLLFHRLFPIYKYKYVMI